MIYSRVVDKERVAKYTQSTVLVQKLFLDRIISKWTNFRANATAPCNHVILLLTQGSHLNYRKKADQSKEEQEKRILQDGKWYVAILWWGAPGNTRQQPNSPASKVRRLVQAWLPSNKQTNWQTDKQTNRQTDKQTNRQTDKLSNIQTYKQTNFKSDKQTKPQTNHTNYWCGTNDLPYMCTNVVTRSILILLTGISWEGISEKVKAPQKELTYKQANYRGVELTNTWLCVYAAKNCQ